MKRVVRNRKPIKAGQEIGAIYTFTADEIAQLLLQMIELNEYPILIEEASEGALNVTVGDSVYQITGSTSMAHK